MLTFLELNGFPIDATDDELIAIGLGVADGSMTYDDLLEWILSNE